MAKRYYICRRLGSGTHDDPYYSELRVWLQENYPNEPHFIQQVIAHVCPWVLMKYNLSDTAHAAVMSNLTGIFSFPAGALDKQLSEIPSATRTTIRDKLEDMGFSFGWATTSNTVRDVLEYIAHTIQIAEWADVSISAANIDTTKTVADVPVAKRKIVNQHLKDLGVDTSWITTSTTLKEIISKVQEKRFGTKQKRWFFHDEDTE